MRLDFHSFLINLSLIMDYTGIPSDMTVSSMNKNSLGLISCTGFRFFGHINIRILKAGF